MVRPAVFLPAGYVAFIFFRSSYRFDDIVSSAVWLMFCVGAIGVAIHVANASQLKIILGNDGVLVKKPLKTTFIKWHDIAEYGREANCRLYGGDRYDVRLVHSGRKVLLFKEGLADLKALNADMMTKAQNAKLINIGPGMI